MLMDAVTGLIHFQTARPHYAVAQVRSEMINPLLDIVWRLAQAIENTVFTNPLRIWKARRSDHPASTQILMDAGYFFRTITVGNFLSSSASGLICLSPRGLRIPHDMCS